MKQSATLLIAPTSLEVAVELVKEEGTHKNKYYRSCINKTLHVFMRKVSFSYLPTKSSETCNRVCVYICVGEIKVLNDFARLDRFRGDFWGDFERLLIFRLFPQALCVGEITCEKCVDNVLQIELLCNGNRMTG